MSATESDSTGIELSADMKAAINGAFGSGKPIAIAYVDVDGAPRLSYRGSTQAFSDTELAIWVRNPVGGILDSIADNPSVALIYGDFNPTDRRFMIMRGRARRDDDATTRERVYSSSHEFEQSQDPERKGVAVVIELESVEGFFGGVRLNMQASRR
jgi:hypothetical protein